MSQRQMDLDEELAALQTLDAPALREKWTDLFGAPPPPRFRRDFLMRAVAYRIQEKECGGLKPATLRELQRRAQDLQEGRETRQAPKAVRLQAGTRLMREWSGETHIVEVLAKGFAWRGATYRSLSAVAVAITGTQWSGPAFFGLLDKRKRPPVDAEAVLAALGS